MTTPLDRTPAQWARHEWQMHYRAATLTDWTTSISGDGRPLHAARVDDPDGVVLLQAFAALPARHGVIGAQQLPVVDWSVPGRVTLTWLLNGEWIVLWAPDAPAPAPVVPKPPIARETPAQAAPRTPVTPAEAPRLIPRPSGRLFARRTNTHKETRT